MKRGVLRAIQISTTPYKESLLPRLRMWEKGSLLFLWRMIQNDRIRPTILPAIRNDSWFLPITMG